MSAKILDFLSHLKQKNTLSQIIQQGWKNEYFYYQKNKSFNIYLVDKSRKHFYFFNCNFEDIKNETELPAITEGHFLEGWRFLTQPSIDYCSTHQQRFFESTLEVIGNLPQWQGLPQQTIRNNLSDQSHMILLIDRQNLIKPLELVLVQTHRDLLTPNHIRKLLEKFDLPQQSNIDENFLRLAWD